jgi:hypothetical protein
MLIWVLLTPILSVALTSKGKLQTFLVVSEEPPVGSLNTRVLSCRFDWGFTALGCALLGSGTSKEGSREYAVFIGRERSLRRLRCALFGFFEVKESRH